MKGTVLLLPISTVPTLDSSDRNNGARAVALVLLATVAVVVAASKRKAAGAFHSAVADVPLNPVPVNVTEVSAHPDVGETDVSLHADAACAVPKNTSMLSMLARMLRRLVNRRP